MPLNHQTSEYLRALDSNQSVGRNKTGWLSGCDVTPSSGGPREVTLSSGEVLVNNSTVSISQTTLAVPSPPSNPDLARIDVVVIGGSGNIGTVTGAAATPTVSSADGDLEPIDGLDEVSGNFAKLHRPLPPDSVGDGVPVASIYSSQDESEVTDALIRDRRVAAIAGGSGGSSTTVSPGNVQAALDSASPGDIVELDPDANWSGATATSDMPWIFQDRQLEGNGVTVAPPDLSSPVMITHTYLRGQVRNLHFDVQASHDTASTSDEKGIIDIDLDHPNLSFDRTITGGAQKYYPGRRPVTNCSFVGVVPDDTSGPSSVPQTPAVRIREAGQGFGVCTLDHVTKGMRHHVYLRSEGGTNPDTGDTWGYLNGISFHGESVGDRIPFKLHNLGSNGCNRHWFHTSVQPQPATEVAIEAIHEGTEPRAVIDNRWVGQFWDLHGYDRSHPDGGQVAAAFDGDNVYDNYIINNNQWGPHYSTDGHTGITESNGAKRNGAIDTRDQFALRLTKPTDPGTGARKNYQLDGSVIGREHHIGVDADWGYPAASNRAAHSIYFGQRENQHAAEFLTMNGNQEPRRESVAPDTNPSQASDFSTDGTGTHQVWPVDTASGSITATLAQDDMEYNGTVVTIIDDDGNADTNPITVTAENGNIVQASGDDTIDHPGGAIEYTSDGFSWHRTGAYLGAGGGGGNEETAVTVASAYSASDDEVVLADASGGSFDVTLPPPTSTLSVTVKKIDSSGNAVGVATPNTETIDGQSSLSISGQWVAEELRSDGSNYFRV